MSRLRMPVRRRRCPVPHKPGFRCKVYAQRAQERMEAKGKQVEPYLCNCGRWHLSSRLAGLRV